MTGVSATRATAVSLAAMLLISGGGCSVQQQSSGGGASASGASASGASTTVASTTAAGGGGATTDTSWNVLFDGTSTAAFRGYRKPGLPDGWKIVDGALTRTASAGDIITRDQFGDFELALEWKISPGGNSGIMYRVTEDSAQSYESGPEMQVLDDTKHPDGKSRLTSAGSLYALYPAPAGHLKPVGEWNAVRILVRGNHVEHWLNGARVVEYELGSPDWEAKVKASKFKEWPGYGRASRGHIALQDHGDWVAYRAIRIRALN